MRAAVLALGLILSAAPSWAQEQRPPIEFVPRFDFHLSAEHLSSDDARFVWDTNFGGDLDIVDYGVGRATFFANYQAILGEELRKFDPNQGNYFLTGSASARVAGLEFAAVLHHESRHLSDRVKRIPVDWNMLGGRVLKTLTTDRLHLDTRADVRGVFLKSFVDYQWEFDGEARGRYTLVPHVAAIAAGELRFMGVDNSQNRGTQRGYRGEGGVRIEGRGGAMEFFIAGERRIDPYPLEFGTDTWFSAGFRLLSR